MDNYTDPWDRMNWTSQPDLWHVEQDGTGVATAKGGTDFWQRTYYNFQRDDGHGLLQRWSGEFSAQLSVEAEYDVLYDQAGLILRAGPAQWIKFGIEYSDGTTQLSVVVTNGASDWSARPIVLDGPITLRATRLGNAVLLQHGDDASGWQMARLAPFMDGAIGIGPYLCAPERPAHALPFEARFSGFQLTDPVVRDLHS